MMNTRSPKSCHIESVSMKWLRSVVVMVGILWMAGGSSPLWAALQGPNKIIFDNQSGQNAVVKVMGPTKLVVKVPKQRKKIVHVAAGPYYIIVRYGDSEKDYSYTKSDEFSVIQKEDQFSIITFTLYRTRGGDFNVSPASSEEFEGAKLSTKDSEP